MAAPVEVTQLLLHAQDPDANVRTQAEARITQYQEQNYSGFVASLAQELCNTQKPADSRRLAGLVLKNNLDAKEEPRKAELQARWGAVDPNLRNQIRESLLTTLQMDPQDVRHTAAMVIAKVAAIDLPRQDWPNLINALLGNMSSPTPHHGVRQATLEALGYICEEMGNIESEVLAPDQINMILTAVVAGMRPEEPSADARLAATTALQNAIVFAQHNMENEQERNYIMQVGANGRCNQPLLSCSGLCTQVVCRCVQSACSFLGLCCRLLAPVTVWAMLLGGPPIVWQVRVWLSKA